MNSKRRTFCAIVFFAAISADCSIVRGQGGPMPQTREHILLARQTSQSQADLIVMLELLNVGSERPNSVPIDLFSFEYVPEQAQPKSEPDWQYVPVRRYYLTPQDARSISNLSLPEDPRDGRIMMWLVLYE